jgi:hypothetical protein
VSRASSVDGAISAEEFESVRNAVLKLLTTPQEEDAHLTTLASVLRFSTDEKARIQTQRQAAQQLNKGWFGFW